MKTMLFCICTILATGPVFAVDSGASSVTASAVTAVKDFEGKLAAPAKDYFIGFRAAKTAAGTVEVLTYALTGPATLGKNRYECVTAPAVNCADLGSAGATAYQPGSRAFAPAEFTQGLNAAMDVFLAKAGAPATIETAKMWQTNGNLELAFSYRPTGGGLKSIFIMCHYHEPGEIDCHKQSRVGKNEPQE